MSAISQQVFSILKEIAENENFITYRINLSNGSEKGDGLLSEITNVQISGQRKTEKCEINDELNLVCKVAFSDKSQREQFKCDIVFEREIYFYNEIAPVFMKFQKERGLTENEIFNAFPKCYKAVYDPEREIFVIIMEDMRVKNFQMWQKGRFAKIENTRLIIRELAKLHAISFAMKDQCPEDFSRFENIKDLWPIFIDPGAIYNITISNFQRVIRMLDKPEHKQIYGIFLKNLKNYYVTCSDESIPRKFCVINHGDAWMNNILFNMNKVIIITFDKFFHSLIIF